MADGGRGIEILPDTSADDRTTSSRSYGAAVVANAEAKTYFNVPFERKDAARAAGLRWDTAVRKWYAPNTGIAKSFSAYACDEAVAQNVHQRFYFNVPFLQKDRAKAMGMRFDGARKCWFAEGEALAAVAGSSFSPLDESAARNQPVSAAERHYSTEETAFP